MRAAVSRAVPPPEHLDYLQQIGVDIHSPALAASRSPVPAAASPAHVPVAVPVAVPAVTHQPAAAPPAAVVVASPPAARRPAARRSPRPRHLPSWWAIVEWAVGILAVAAAIVILVMFLMARGVLAQEAPTPDAAPTPTTAAPEEQPAVPKRPTSKSQKAKSPSAKRRDAEPIQSPVAAPVEKPAAGSPPVETQAAPTPPPAPAASVIPGPSVPFEGQGPAASLSAPVQPAREEEHPSKSPRPPRGSPAALETVIGIAFLSGLGYYAWDRRKLGSRLGQLEAALRGDSSSPSPAPAAVEDDAAPLRAPAPSALLNAESPEAALGALIAEAKRRGVTTLPKAATRRWGAGVASITGPVRKENQDAAILFEVDSTAVLIVADGLGGLPRGQQAARVAVGAAAISAAEALGGSASPVTHPELVAEQALLESAAALCRQARASGWVESRDGFRTTLICVVATPSTYGYCYLGDGGGVVVRSGGTVDAFLVPQKADGISNVVAGSLGPVLQGTPVVGKLPRRPGDSLFIGTDGVFDRVPEGFAVSVVRLLAAHDGDAQAVASVVVSDFASAKDGAVYVCDDNMTFVILCTPTPRPGPMAVTVPRAHVSRR
jgi:serine/threonine protein phosphatase PrpC